MSETPHILIAENSKHPLKKLADLLKSEGYHIGVSHSGEDAFSTLVDHTSQYHAIILDHRTPDNKEHALLTKISTASSLKTLPIILIVPDTHQNTLRDAIQRGAHYCLSEDASSDHALQIIQAAIRRNLSYRELQNLSPTTSYPMMQYLIFGEFQVKTLGEAQDLARGLSTICPNPNLAVVGISELLINAIEHGNLAITYAEKSQYKRDNTWEAKITERQKEPKHRHKTVDVQFKKTETEFIIQITDQGAGFDSKKVIDLNPERLLDTHGRGIMMARNLVFKDLVYSPKGNQVTVVIPQRRATQ